VPDLKLSRRSSVVVAGVIALTVLPLNASYAFHWPWQKNKPEKASAKPAASQKPADTDKTRAAKLTPDEKPVAFNCDPTAFRIVVDVGHTAESDGAMSARNVPEFQFNLNLAKRIVEELKSGGFPQTRLLVTTGKARPSLFKRVAAADALKGNFLLSIHHDSVPDKFMENWNFEGKPSHFSDRFSGYSIFVAHSNMDFKTSFAFARLLGRQMKAQGLQYATQYTQSIMGRYQHELLDKDVGVYANDQLIVLKFSQMPAALLEAGSIINRDEELKMASAERQDMTVKAVTSAMQQFCGVAQPQLAAKRRPEADNQPQATPVEVKTQSQSSPAEAKSEQVQSSRPEAESHPEASSQAQPK
jgi:N-acetylmuramoyl-L-alanine amidase